MHRGTEIMVDSDSSECARHIRARAFCCPQGQRGRRYNGSPLIGGVGRGSCVRLGSDPASRLGSRMQYLAAPRRAHMCMPLVQRSIRQRGHGPGAARSLYRRRAGRASWPRSISVSARLLPAPGRSGNTWNPTMHHTCGPQRCVPAEPRKCSALVTKPPARGEDPAPTGNHRCVWCHHKRRRCCPLTSRTSARDRLPVRALERAPLCMHYRAAGRSGPFATGHRGPDALCTLVLCTPTCSMAAMRPSWSKLRSSF
ncbi:hypothetical protein C8Q77DRAFT_35208 [Trametes polyzona]|nr:hypothetical protein C8Q77DRAFT_35208 [Trametes polyzona]